MHRKSLWIATLLRAPRQSGLTRLFRLSLAHATRPVICPAPHSALRPPSSRDRCYCLAASSRPAASLLVISQTYINVVLVLNVAIDSLLQFLLYREMNKYELMCHGPSDIYRPANLPRITHWDCTNGKRSNMTASIDIYQPLATSPY